MLRLLRDLLVAVAGGFVTALVGSLAQADLNVILAAGIGVCLLLLLTLVAVPGIAGVVGKPLTVKVADRHAHPLNYAAETAALQLLIKNRRWRPVELSGGFGLGVNSADNPMRRAGLTEQEKASLVQKLGYERETSHHQPSLRDRAVVPAHGSLSPWVVTDVDRLPSGGHPEITIKFADGEGNQYALVVKRQGRRPGQLPWWRRLWSRACAVARMI